MPLLDRHFTIVGESTFDLVDWEIGPVEIVAADGTVVYAQPGTEFPVEWSKTARQIVASKYFYGQLGVDREFSLKQLLQRVVCTIADAGVAEGYFGTGEDDEEMETFEDELTAILLSQRASFNSPVWFNIGVENEAPQASACYINSIEDDMGSILDLAKTEGIIFKRGSGAGVNLSPLRGENEKLRGGGIASGPVSFMKGYDAFAGAIKSGGKTRRAAKIIILDADHPDIMQFVQSKTKEEAKALTLIEAGYDSSIDGEAYGSVFFQNANHSVMVSDEFMELATGVFDDTSWYLVNRGDGVSKPINPRKLFREMASAAWRCGDPGLMFRDAMNEGNTCKNSGQIVATNPCGEYIWLNDTSCNLASINLMAFYDGENFNLSDFEQTVRVMITAMDILCGMAEYPTEKIAENTLKYRTLGLGFTNLGAVLMAYGMSYDSSRARNWAAQLTSDMTSEAYLQSAKIAAVMGPFPEYEKNAEEMHDVLQRQGIKATKFAQENHGFRNAQVTVLAPTGTISFMMDADTTGIEPLLTLTPRKTLVGGGEIAVFPACFEMGLKKLGYDPDIRQQLMDFVKDHGQLFDEVQLPILADEDVDIFATAIGVNNTIPPEGHLKMLQACQKHLSGGISKTVNLPATATVQDVERIYTQAWQLGLKNISIYRDGCKESQPVVGFKKVGTTVPTRRKLPPERPAITHKFNVAGHEGYLTVGLFDDGSPGEVFVTMAKEGSTISGVMGAFATMISLSLQYGIPLRFLTTKFKDSRYEPSGYTGNAEIPYAKSLTDYIFQWMALRFPSGHIVQHTPTEEPAEEPTVVDSSAPFCSLCEEQMVSTGGQCYACKSCGETSGGCG